ncbi:MAG: hypothetical protein ACE37F_18290 [Nannocystaceae bacterium]|nr:hypothetical protein [bacterium]
MKRLAIGIALGLVAAPLTGCDKEEKKEEASGEKGKDGDKTADKGGDKGEDKAAAGATVADAMKLIPDGMNVVVGLDAAAVAASALMKDNADMLQQGDAGEMMAAADACKVGMPTWKYAVVGVNTDNDKQGAIIVSATGLGKKDTLECIGKKVKEKNPDDKFEVGEEDGRVVVTGKDDAKVYAVSDDVIAFSGPDSKDAVKELIGGKGKTALDGSLKEVAAAMDQSKHIYFGMVATADMQSGPTAGIKHVTGSVDLSNGLAIAASGEFGDEAKAKELATMANQQFAQLKGMAGPLGVPQTVVDSVKIEAKGGAVMASAKATDDDLKKLAETAKKQMAGPGGAPGGAAAPH